MASINRKLNNDVIAVMTLDENGLNIKLYDKSVKAGNEILLSCYEDVLGGLASNSDMLKVHACIDMLVGRVGNER